MSLRGDVRTLKNIGKNLPTVEIAQRVAARVAPEITRLALASFDAGETPYGDPWLPGHDGRDVDLVESGKLRDTLSYVAVGRIVRCVLGVKYARFQIGTRAILPRGGQTLPDSWRGAIKRIALEEIHKAVA